MRRKALIQKDQVTEEEHSEENITVSENVDENLSQDVIEKKTSGESSGISSSSKRGRKKNTMEETESDVANGSTANGEDIGLASKRGGKKGNKNVNVKQNKESSKDVAKPVSNGNVNEKDVELNAENKKLEDNEHIAKNSKTNRKRNINEVLMEGSKKQAKNTKKNDKSIGETSEDIKPVEEQEQGKESSANKDLTTDVDEDFISDTKGVSRKRGKRGLSAAEIRSNTTEKKGVPTKNMQVNDTKMPTEEEYPSVSEPDKKAQSFKGNRRRKIEKEEESVNEAEIKHTKSEKANSNEAVMTKEISSSSESNKHVQPTKGNQRRNKKEGKSVNEAKTEKASFDEVLVAKKLTVVLDRCEESEQTSEKEDTPDDTIMSLKNGKGKASTKRKREKDVEEKDSKKTKAAKDSKQPGSSKGASKKEKIPDVTSIDFSNESKSSNGKPWNFKMSSWNINGIRAWLEKNGLSFLHHEKPDVLCLQETKCSDDKLPKEVKEVEGYHAYWLAGDKDGYSGVGLLSKKEPLSIEYGIGISEHDNEGRVITAEYEDFFVVAVYVPNAGRGLVRLDYRMKWDQDFRAYLKKLDEKKPVILCGDLNVAHEEIDLANPKTNKKNAGFTKEEREGFSTLLSEGFIDTFRHLYPDVKGAYTFWTYMMNARAKNVGWRLDYFVISKRFGECLCDSVIRKDVLGSDHCPVTLFLAV